MFRREVYRAMLRATLSIWLCTKALIKRCRGGL